MPEKNKALVFGVIVLLVAFGAAAALASGSDPVGSKRATVVNDGGQQLESSQAREPGDGDDVGEISHPGDEAEDRAEGPDTPITGPDLERASQAALDYLGEGEVTGTEIEDEESYYEIEVTLDDGRQVDVQLDESFEVVGTD